MICNSSKLILCYDFIYLAQQAHIFSNIYIYRMSLHKGKFHWILDYMLQIDRPFHRDVGVITGTVLYKTFFPYFTSIMCLDAKIWTTIKSSYYRDTEKAYNDYTILTLNNLTCKFSTNGQNFYSIYEEEIMKIISYERCVYESIDDMSPSWVTFQNSTENQIQAFNMTYLESIN